MKIARDLVLGMMRIIVATKLFGFRANLSSALLAELVHDHGPWVIGCEHHP